MARLLDRLQEPEVRNLPVDAPERFSAHREVLRRKPLIRDIFRELHVEMRRLDDALLRGEGMRVELGAGVFPVKETHPDTLATDVVMAAHLDRRLDALDMDLPAGSVRAFYLLNMFHHRPDPSAFFRELERTLMPGGGAILIEPACGPLARLVYPRLFASEGYDPDVSDWRTPVGGPMSGANQALSHVVFDRDLARFTRDHPALEVAHRDVMPNYARYLVSGGLNFRPLLPERLAGAVKAAEYILHPLRRTLGLHRILVLRKREPA